MTRQKQRLRIKKQPDRHLLAGRTVVIWPDADRCGYEAAMAVATILEEISTAANIVLPPQGFKTGWDLADAEDEGWDSIQVIHHIENNALSLSAFKDHAKKQYGVDSPYRQTKRIKQQKVSGIIRIEKGTTGKVVDACEAVLSRPDLPHEFRIFQRGSQLVRLGKLPAFSQGSGTICPQESVVIMEVKKAFILDVLGAIADL
jgi:putative DNA primase/helicase